MFFSTKLHKEKNKQKSSKKQNIQGVIVVMVVINVMKFKHQ